MNILHRQATLAYKDVLTHINLCPRLQQLLEIYPFRSSHKKMVSYLWLSFFLFFHLNLLRKATQIKTCLILSGFHILHLSRHNFVLRHICVWSFHCTDLASVQLACISLPRSCSRYTSLVPQFFSFSFPFLHLLICLTLLHYMSIFIDIKYKHFTV